MGGDKGHRTTSVVVKVAVATAYRETQCNLIRKIENTRRDLSPKNDIVEVAWVCHKAYRKETLKSKKSQWAKLEAKNY